ncbi:DNA mismatch repair protein MutT [Metarhizobium album]|uniref:DNA mismatch repair protein MutT n=1 Tax=Metarhizobium album TaxID=2182425 RepID=A0A2U2DK28_9HYPH|nr:NUDIX hydrolase [Rhizobium album]PWE53662.1 DNA mismatch repair protein MutT [Rhizobium album]
MSDERLYRSAFADLVTVTGQILRGDCITQYAAICVRDHGDDVDILLITSRDTGRWVIPKGWGMRNKKAHQVARREAWEEAGVIGKVKKKPFGFYTYAKRLRGGGIVPAIVQVHLLHVHETRADFPELGQRVVRWFNPSEAASLVKEPELRSMVRQVPAYLNHR